MKSLRLAYGRTAANVASRTRVGKPLTRAVISDLETGRKKTLDISELLTIAAALEVSPLSLLVPNVLGEVEVLPGMSLRGIDALAWYLGVDDVPGMPLEVLNLGDSALRLAIRMVEVDKLLRIQRHNLFQHEQGLQTLSISDHMEAYEREQVEHTRRQIEILEREQEQLVGLYERKISERSSDG